MNCFSDRRTKGNFAGECNRLFRVVHNLASTKTVRTSELTAGILSAVKRLSAPGAFSF